MAFNKRKPGKAAKISPREAMAIREDYATGQWSQPQLAVKYGIGVGQVGKIIRGEAWVGVTHGEAVVTQQEIEMRQAGMLTAPLSVAAQGTNYIEREAQRSLERLRAIGGAELFDGAGGGGSPSSRADAPTLEAAHQQSVDARLSGYMKLMAQAELAADSSDGTTVRREQIIERMKEELVVPSPRGKIARVDAEKLLETLKDEQATNARDTSEG